MSMFSLFLLFLLLSYVLFCLLVAFRLILDWYLAVYIPLQCEHLYRHLADYRSLLVRTVLAEDALFTAHLSVQNITF